MRTLRFTGFTLLEYVRSGRVALEIIATLVAYFVFLRRVGLGMNAEYFFSVTGIYTPALTLYSTAAFIGIGDRPQGYVLLARGVSRATYLLGIFFSALVIVAGSYGLLSILSALFNRPPDLDFGGWLLGTLPLLLNIGLLSALMLMLSPLVFTTNWRLFVLGLIALAFSSNFIGGTLLESLPETARTLLRAAQAILGGPLVPAFYGFQLAVTRDYTAPTAVANLVAQGSLLISLLGLAIYSFSRRDLIFSHQ
jgi:ABC-type transport system involved in multi-copper enzyme maturation permease subunit